MIQLLNKNRVMGKCHFCWKKIKLGKIKLFFVRNLLLIFISNLDLLKEEKEISFGQRISKTT